MSKRKALDDVSNSAQKKSTKANETRKVKYHPNLPVAVATCSRIRPPDLSEDAEDEESEDDMEHTKQANNGFKLLAEELRGLGESANFTRMWLFHLKSANNGEVFRHREAQIQSKTSSGIRKNHVSPVASRDWLLRAEKHLVTWSRSKGISEDRLAEVQQLRLTDIILTHSTIFLRSMLKSIISGAPFELYSEDICSHTGIDASQVWDGVYARFGVGEPDHEGLLQSNDIPRFANEMKCGIRPRFFYVGESNNMFLRSITHDIDAFSSTAARYRLVSSVKAVVQLPLIILPAEGMGDRDQLDLRLLLEAVLISALGAFQSNMKYNDMRHDAGLHFFQQQMAGVNGSAGTIRQHVQTSNATAQANTTLRSILQTVLREFSITLMYTKRLQIIGGTTQDQLQRIHVERKKNEHQAAFEAAKDAYRKEKGRLLTSGAFLCIARKETDEREGRLAATYSLSNLFGAALKGEDLQRMVEDGVATATTSKTTSNTDEYVFQIQFVEAQPSAEDYYVNASPANYDFAKGVQLRAVKGGKSLTMVAYNGGPKRHLAVRDDDGTYKSLSLMRFVVSLTSDHQYRLAALESYPTAWWKRKKSADRILRSNDLAVNNIKAKELASVDLALLDGCLRVRSWFDRCEDSRRRVALYFTEGVRMWKLLTLTEDEFVRTNPQFSIEKQGHYFVRINLERQNDHGEIQIKSSADGVSSQRLPIALDMWHRETGWLPLKLQCLGGEALMEALIRLVKCFSIPIRATSSCAPPTPDPMAPAWIDSVRNTQGHKARGWPMRLTVDIRHLDKTKEGKRVAAKLSYPSTISRSVAQDMNLHRGDTINVHIDFWQHNSPSNYRVLISKIGSNPIWFAIAPAKALQAILERIRTSHNPLLIH